MQNRVCVFRFAVSGAITLVILFVLCWIGAVMTPTAFTHMFVALFAPAPMTSWQALGWGLCSALLFGFFAGGVLAISYNISAWTTQQSARRRAE